MTDRFTQALGLERYVLFMQDYGGPVGFRLARVHPECVQAMIVQRMPSPTKLALDLYGKRAYWADRAANEAQLRANLMSLDAARQRHVGTSPYPERYDPDLWTDEFAFLSRASQEQIQSDLFYDYRTNVAAYREWQAWLRRHRPPLLVLWGTYDPSFTLAGAEAYRADVPDAQVHLLPPGHFAMDEAANDVAALTAAFLRRLFHQDVASMSRAVVEKSSDHDPPTDTAGPATLPTSKEWSKL